MNVRLPDFSGPPVWWDIAVCALWAAGVAGVVRHRLRCRR